MLSLEPGGRNRAILMLLYASGVRVSELCGLCWRDVQANGEGAQITVLGKGAKTRAVQLPHSVSSLLAKLRGGAGIPIAQTARRARTSGRLPHRAPRRRWKPGMPDRASSQGITPNRIRFCTEFRLQPRIAAT